MSRYQLRIRPEADEEVAEAARWYEARERGLGREFLRAVRTAVAPLRRNPFLFAPVVDEARRVLVRRFPYSVFYEVHEEEVVVLACFHQARDPEEWQRLVSTQGQP